MNDPRDDLAAIIFDKSGLGEWSATQLADAIIAAGWRPPAKTYPEHEVDMERFPACTICGRDVVWNDKFQRWEH